MHEAGDPDGLPVVVHHGTPASGLLYDVHVELAREQGIRLIGYDRPGYGPSDRHAGRSVADAAADVSAIADSLGLERYGSWGISGGGPHVLACAALCDERLGAVASLAAGGPYAAQGGRSPPGRGRAARASRRSRPTEPRGSITSREWARRTMSSSARCWRSKERSAPTSSTRRRRCSVPPPTTSSPCWRRCSARRTEPFSPVSSRNTCCSPMRTRSSGGSTAGSTTTLR